jgi:hypothetical protein
MEEYGLVFEAPNICCVADGGDFAGHLSDQRDEAALVYDDNDAGSFHAVRDPNVNFRFKLYAHFVKNMGLLGRGRVQIPLCYMSAVREIWPSKDGVYVGFIFKT